MTMPQDPSPANPSRRRFMIRAGAALVGGGVSVSLAYQHFARADVFIAKAENYTSGLAEKIRHGLTEIGFDRRRVQNKSVLLKPNLVEPTREAPHINTHPLFIQAVAEVFRGWDAREVVVAEGQGHCRDSILVLEQSGLAPILTDGKLDFVDLNHDEVYHRPNALGATGLRELILPTTLQRADLIVSLPKMKLHHWAGVTLSMKNLFGVLPGICYGWPKNVLHQVGISQSILDINLTVKPHLAIIDGIVAMEGDGPIMGTPKNAGVIVMGDNFSAVDCTATRLMGLDPARIEYLAHPYARRIGPKDELLIRQRGEALRPLVQQFHYPANRHFQQFQTPRIA